MNFCDVCENRLEAITDIKLYYQCTKCNKQFPAEASDTLRFTQTFNKKDSSIKYDTLIQNAAYDNTNPKEYHPCPVCNRQIVTYVVVDDMKYIYICLCGNKF